jgi:MFS family permease
VVALGAAEAMVGPAIAGYLSDRCRSRFGRRRPFVAIGAAMTALALLFMGRADSLVLLTVAYLLLQISDDVGTGPYAALIPDYVPQEHRGRASGIMSVLQSVAQLVAAGVAFALGSNFFLLCVAIAVINLVCAGIVWVTVHEPAYTPMRETVTTANAESAAKTSSAFVRLQNGLVRWIAPFRSPDFRWVWLTRFLVALGFYLITLYVSNYLNDRVKVFLLGPIDLKKTLYASLVAAVTISLCGAIGAIIAGKHTDKWGHKRMIVLSGYLMAGAIIPFALIPHFMLMLFLAAIFGIGYGAYQSASWALAADVLPNPEEAAKDMGIWQASVSTPQIVGGAVGFLVDVGNRGRPGAGYSIAFLIAAAAFFAGCLLVVRVKGSS